MIMMTQSAQIIRMNVLRRSSLIAHAVMINRNAKKYIAFGMEGCRTAATNNVDNTQNIAAK